MQPPDLLSLFVAPINALNLTYMVTGAVAATVYGEPRLTNDVDIVLALDAADVPRLHEAFASPHFYVPPAETIAEEIARATGGHFNIIHGPTALKADVYPAGDDPLHRWALNIRRLITVGGVAVWIAPPEYVILRKLQWLRDGASDKHRRDIAAMVAMLGDELDGDSLLARVHELNLDAEWRSVSGSPRS